MKTPRFLTTLTVALPLVSASAFAQTFVQETFDYSGSTLNGQTGGTGFRTGGTYEAWTDRGSPSFATQSFNDGAWVVGNGTNNPLTSSSAYGRVQRDLPSYSADTFFVSYTFSFSADTLTNADRFYMILVGAGNSGGWGTIELGMGLNNTTANDSALADTNLTLRTNSTSNGGTNRRSVAPGFVADTEYTIVAEISKVGSLTTGKYGQVKVWVNPGEDDYLNPVMSGSISSTQTLSSVNGVLFVLDETEATDQYRLHDFRFGESFDAVTAVPEPSTFALLGGLATLGLAGFSRRRSTK